MQLQPLEQARRALRASQANYTTLKDEYSKPEADNRKVGGLHQSINYGMKAAEISALIAIGEQLEALVKARS